MRYFANPCGADVVNAMLDGRLGYIDTPLQGNRRPEGVTWCADNGAFSAKWDAGRWFAWLQKNAEHASTCEFAVVPDVVGDAYQTLDLWYEWAPRVRELGYPLAFVAQDGLTSETTPWDEFSVLFLGGSTEFKLGPEAEALTREAKARGKAVHMGRVNSRKRMRLASSWGVDSVDGTLLTFGPSKHLSPLLRWLDEINDEENR